MWLFRTGDLAIESLSTAKEHIDPSSPTRLTNGLGRAGSYFGERTASVMVSTVPMGVALGSLMKSSAQAGLMFLLSMLVILVSGIFYSIAALPTWLQRLGQAFPVLLGRTRRTLRNAPGRDGRGRDRWVDSGRHAARADPARPRCPASIRVHPGRDARADYVRRLLTVRESGDVVHNRLAMLRAERRIVRRDQAEALGAHYQTIGYLDRGEYSPSLRLALRIAAYFDVPVEIVFSLNAFERLGTNRETGHSEISPPRP